MKIATSPFVYRGGGCFYARKIGEPPSQLSYHAVSSVGNWNWLLATFSHWQHFTSYRLALLTLPDVAKLNHRLPPLSVGVGADAFGEDRARKRKPVARLDDIVAKCGFPVLPRPAMDFVTNPMLSADIFRPFRLTFYPFPPIFRKFLPMSVASLAGQFVSPCRTTTRNLRL